MAINLARIVRDVLRALEKQKVQTYLPLSYVGTYIRQIHGLAGLGKSRNSKKQKTMETKVALPTDLD